MKITIFGHRPEGKRYIIFSWKPQVVIFDGHPLRTTTTHTLHTVFNHFLSQIGAEQWQPEDAFNSSAHLTQPVPLRCRCRSPAWANRCRRALTTSKIQSCDECWPHTWSACPCAWYAWGYFFAIQSMYLPLQVSGKVEEHPLQQSCSKCVKPESLRHQNLWLQCVIMQATLIEYLSAFQCQERVFWQRNSGDVFELRTWIVLSSKNEVLWELSVWWCHGWNFQKKIWGG